jgi:uncharacterized membrane protein YphA (DoxX/SURF4 family)
MKNVKIAYWLSTGFVAFACIGSGMMGLIGSPEMTEANRAIGLPEYLAPFLGVIKILGAITILVPALKRFHEAAYAGLIFYFIGATYVLVASGGGIDKYGITLFILMAVVISYLSSLRKKNYASLANISSDNIVRS